MANKIQMFTKSPEYVCNMCAKSLAASKFCKNKAMENNINSICKKCSNESSAKYRKTKRGLVTVLYGSQRFNSKMRNHPPPSHSKSEFAEWLYSKTLFHELYDTWKASGYIKKLKPSCDRIDDYIGYSLSNMQIMTWEDNHKKYMKDAKAGVNLKGCIPVIGTHIVTGTKSYFFSIAEAERVTNINHTHISDCAHGKRNTAGGYRWSVDVDKLIGDKYGVKSTDDN